MRNGTVRRSAISFFLLALFVLVSIAQVTTVNSEEHEVPAEVGRVIATKRGGRKFLVFPVSGSFDTVFIYDGLKYPRQMTANSVISGIDLNLTGTLKVNVIHVNGTPVSNLPIKLENPPGTIIVNATTDNDGKYAFEYLGLNETYQVSLVYEGVPYYKEFSFKNGGLAQLNFVVYETTRSDEDIRIRARQVIVQTDEEGHLGVSEYIVYENLGIKVFNNSWLRVWLPREMHDFSTSIMDCCIQVNEGGAIFNPMDPIMPGGQYSMWMNYCIDVVSSEYVFRRKVDYSTHAFHLFVENKGDIKVTSASELESQGTVTIDDTEHMFFVGFGLEAGIYITVKLVGLASSSNLMNQIAGTILISMTTAFLVLYPIIREKREGKASVEDLEAKKLAIFKKIAQLESDYESGDVSQNRYERLRSRYRKRAIQLMQLIDEARSHRPQSKQSLSDQRIEEQALLSTLQKLEEDFKRGLISREGYQKIKATYEGRRIRVMEEIRKLEETEKEGE